MLKRWRVRNFKAFRSPESISLSAINILAGANSSGKSSIIQSILLLKQSLQYGPENRAMTLNGPLLRLGSFDDVRHFKAIGEDIGFDFDFEFSSDEASTFMEPLKNRKRFGSKESHIIKGICVSLAYGEGVTNAQNRRRGQLYT